MSEIIVKVTSAEALAEINRRAENNLAKTTARMSGAPYVPKAAANTVVQGLSGEALKTLAATEAPTVVAPAAPAAPAKAKAKVRTEVAWNEPGVRGGDPVKRNRGLLATKLVGEKGTPAWWEAYRMTKDMTLDELGLELGFITA